MANNRCTYQQEHTVSIKKANLLEISQNKYLDETDLRVLLCLLTELNGWCPSKSGMAKDPENYTKVHADRIAETLGIKKKHVKKSIDKLIDSLIIEYGSNDTVKKGYRFTF